MPAIRLAQYLSSYKKAAHEFIPASYSKTRAKSTLSHFGGTPYMEKGQEWPTCGCCGEEMGFIAQFNLAEIFGKSPEKGSNGYLYSLFFCWHCYKNKEVEDQWVVRVYPKPKPGSRQVVKPEISPHEVSPSKINYKPIVTLPAWESRHVFDDEEKLIKLVRAIDNTNLKYHYKHSCELLGCHTDGLSSVGGYSKHEQSKLESVCPTCDKQREILVQIVSVRHYSIPWAKDAVGYLLQCPDHPESIDFKVVSGG